MKVVLNLLNLLLLSSCVNSEMNDTQQSIYAKMSPHSVNLYAKSPVHELAQAVDRQDTDEIYRILKKDSTSIDYREKLYGESLLFWAVYANKISSTKALIEMGADPNSQANDSISALILAAGKEENADYLKALLKRRCDVNQITTGPFKTPLIAAASASLENVKLLVEKGANIDYRDLDFHSALHEACLQSMIDIVHYLIIEKKADFNYAVGFTLAGDSLYIVDDFRNMTFDLQSKEYQMKMEVVNYMKRKGVDYWKTSVPQHLYKIYSKEYLEKY